MKTLLCFAATAAAIAASPSGCVSVPVLVREARTNVFTQVFTNWHSVTNFSTNLVEVTMRRTNSVGDVTTAPALQPQIIPSVLLTPLVSTSLVTQIIPPVYYTNISLAPGIAETAQAVGNVIPVPGAGAGTTTALAVVGGIFSLVNEWRRRKALSQADAAERKAQTSESKAQTWQTASQTLVANVETIRKAAMSAPGYTSAMDHAAMRVVQTAQAAAGVATEIHNLVEANTETTAPAGFHTRPTAEDLIDAALGKIPVGKDWNKYEVADVERFRRDIAENAASAQAA